MHVYTKFRFAFAMGGTTVETWQGALIMNQRPYALVWLFDDKHVTYVSLLTSL